MFLNNLCYLNSTNEQYSYMHNMSLYTFFKRLVYCTCNCSTILFITNNLLYSHMQGGLELSYMYNILKCFHSLASTQITGNILNGDQISNLCSQEIIIKYLY